MYNLASVFATKFVLASILVLAASGIVIVVIGILSYLLGGALFIATRTKVVKKMVALADIQRGEKVYDLGCGDGRLLIEANKKYGAEAIGIEISPFVFWLAKITTLIHRAKVTLVRGNIYKADFSDADVVFCYLMPEMMQKLEMACK